jgi:hypothetical protein
MGVVRISQLDGKLPNVALLRLSAWHRARGDGVRFFAGAAAAERHLDEPVYDKVYGSAIFTFSRPLVDRFRAEFPEAILGGTGTGDRVVQTVVPLADEFFDRGSLAGPRSAQDRLRKFRAEAVYQWP